MTSIKSVLNIFKSDDSEITELYPAGKVFNIPISEIKPNPNNTRRALNRDSISALTASVKECGICTPICVRYINNKFYELVSGERRLLAAKNAGLTEIPAVLLSSNDRKSALMWLIENIHREPLLNIEKAEGFYNLKNNYGFSENEIAHFFSIRVTEVYRFLRLMDFDSECRRIIAENDVPVNIAQKALKIDDEAVRKSTLKKIAAAGMTEKEADDIVDDEIKKLEEEKILIYKMSDKHSDREKMHISDMRILANTVKKSVELINRYGVKADYSVEKSDDGTKIVINIPTETV